jgi:hypothetical protein
MISLLEKGTYRRSVERAMEEIAGEDISRFMSPAVGRRPPEDRDRPKMSEMFSERRRVSRGDSPRSMLFSFALTKFSLRRSSTFVVAATAC